MNGCNIRSRCPIRTEVNKQAEEESKEPGPEEKKETMRFFIIGCALGVIIVFALVVFILPRFQEQPTGAPVVEYNYFTFEKIADMWTTHVKNNDQLFEVTLRYNPFEVENLTITGELDKSFNQGEIYVTFNPLAEDEEFRYLALAASELALNLVRGLNKTIIPSCTKNETDACINRSVVDCSHEDKSVIFIDAKPPTQIILDGRCVTLQGKELELIRAVDRLLYQWYGIIR